MVRVKKEKEESDSKSNQDVFKNFFNRFKRKKQKFSPKIVSKKIKVRETDKFSITQKYLIVFVVIVSFFILVIAGGYLFNIAKGKNVQAIPVCGDNSFYDTCSLTKPYFCLDGALLEKASVCGCPEILKREGDSCISDYQNSSKEITLKYVLRGEEKEINYVVYGGLVDYLFNLPKSISYDENEKPSRRDFKLKNLDEKEQKELLLGLVMKIQNLTPVEEDQMRIAVSLVQNIPYAESEKTFIMRNVVFNYSRYPYEVLYDNAGICGEKSELLAFLLREMGYEVVFFYHAYENHESVGIKCPVKESLDDTGYCFIETTGLSIITDDSIEYVGGISLVSEPEVALISIGDSLGKDLYEYKDADSMKRVRNGGISFFRSIKFNNLKEKYGLVDEYNLG
ncbi:hypothetical protein KAT80_01385 [Candidatus Pacearchaeota archaeon]|nr:hypothetical protein [Candidatus Pacearchaeota archaeon]